MSHHQVDYSIRDNEKQAEPEHKRRRIDTITRPLYAIMLQWVWLPASVREIGEGAFEGCGKLTLICEEGAQVPIAYAESHGIPYLTY